MLPIRASAICICRCANWLRLGKAAGMTILPACGLRNIGNNLHTTWNNTRRATTSGSIRRRGRASETFGELFDKCNSDIVRCNVNGIRNTKNHERSLSGKW